MDRCLQVSKLIDVKIVEIWQMLQSGIVSATKNFNQNISNIDRF